MRGGTVPSNRLSGLNVILLFITLLALAFGAYGFLRPPLQQEGVTRKAARSDTPDEPAPKDRSHGAAAGSSHDDKAKAKPMPVAADQPPTPPPEKPVMKASLGGPSDHGDATLSGIVVDAAGAAIAGVTVSARRSNLPLTPPPVESRDPERSRDAVARYLEQVMAQTRATTTDSEGQFTFTGLDAALAYDLTAVAPSGARGQRERIAANDKVTLVLQPTLLLHGRVVDPQGDPVTQFSVRTWRPNMPWEARQQSFLTRDGRFEVECSAGMLSVEITAAGLYQGQPAEIIVEAGNTEHVFRLAQGAILSGVVRDKQGLPVANARISTGGADTNNWDGRRSSYNPGYPTAPEARTDSQGRYRLESLGPREYTITATYGASSDTKTLVLAAGPNVQDFTLDSGAHLSITLKDSKGKPVEAEQVWFMNRNNQWQRGEKLPARDPGLTEYAGLKPDEYTVLISAPGYPAVRRSVKLSAGANSLEVELPDGAFVVGTLTTSGGAALNGVSLRLVKEGENENEAWGAGRWAQVRSNGTYKLGPVEPGQWNIQVMTQDWTVVATERRSLSAGDNNVDLVIAGGGTLTVKITLEGGGAPSWSYVTLSNVKDSGTNYAGYANQSGSTTISFIEPGDYHLYVSAQGLAAPTQVVTVREGANSISVVVRKPNCARITAVTPNSQAAKAGIQVGDLLLEYNGEKINAWEDVGRIRRKYTNNDDVTLTIERDGRQMVFSIKGGQIGIDGESAVR